MTTSETVATTCPICGERRYDDRGRWEHMDQAHRDHGPHYDLDWPRADSGSCQDRGA